MQKPDDFGAAGRPAIWVPSSAGPPLLERSLLAPTGPIIFDTVLPPIPNLNGLMSAGGSLAVTYRVLNASGKYKVLIGRQFTAKVVATNALPSAVSGGVFGSVYAEVYAPDVESIERALNR